MQQWSDFGVRQPAKSLANLTCGSLTTPSPLWLRLPEHLQLASSPLSAQADIL